MDQQIVISIATVMALGSLIFWLWIYSLHQKSQKAKKPAELKQAEFNGTESAQMELGDIKIHFVKTMPDKNTTLVLLHGIAASSYSFRHVLNRFGKNRLTIAVDLPGFGLSDKPHNFDYSLDGQAKAMIQLLDHLKRGPYFILGSSMGALIALKVAELRPDLTKGIIAISPPVSRSIVPVPTGTFTMVSRPSRFLMNEFFVKVLLNRVISKKEVISPEVIKAYTYPYLDDGSSIRAFLRASESIRAKDNPEFLTKVKTPTLFLWGAKDKVVPVRLAPKAQRFVAGSELLIHENAGHHPMEDHPEWVVEVTENFLSRLKA